MSELDNSNNSHLEIERVFLLHTMPILPDGARKLRIIQAYFPDSENDEVMAGRIRKTVYSDGNIVCTNTIKEGEGLVRTEKECELSQQKFDSEWHRTEKQRISKTRYEVDAEKLTWQIDVFDEPAGLIMAEIELESESTDVEIPHWLQDCIKKEVTTDSSYTNRAIARRLGGLD